LDDLLKQSLSTFFNNHSLLLPTTSSCDQLAVISTSRNDSDPPALSSNARYDSSDSTVLLTDLIKRGLILLGIPEGYTGPGMTEYPGAAYYLPRGLYAANLALQPLMELYERRKSSSLVSHLAQGFHLPNDILETSKAAEANDAARVGCIDWLHNASLSVPTGMSLFVFAAT